MENRQKAPTSVGPISSFAHLAGALAAKADNDKDEKDDEEDRKKDEKDAKKAEEEEAARVKAEEKEKEEKDKEAARKKAAKEKDTSDDDGDYDDKKARHAERERIHAIMTCIGAKHAVEEAEYIAFCTDAPAAEAIGHLNVKAIELLSEKALSLLRKRILFVSAWLASICLTSARTRLATAVTILTRIMSARRRPRSLRLARSVGARRSNYTRAGGPRFPIWQQFYNRRPPWL